MSQTAVAAFEYGAGSSTDSNGITTITIFDLGGFGYPAPTNVDYTYTTSPLTASPTTFIDDYTQYYLGGLLGLGGLAFVTVYGNAGGLTVYSNVQLTGGSTYYLVQGADYTPVPAVTSGNTQTISNGATIASIALAGGSLSVSGTANSVGTVAIGGGTSEIYLSAGAGLSISSLGALSIANGAALEVVGGSLVVGGSIVLTGVLSEMGGSLYDNGVLVNNGTITLDPSTMTVPSLAGSGVVTIETQSTLDVTGNIDAGQTIFFAGTSAELQITDTADIAGTLSGAGTIDITDLSSFSFASFNSATDLLGITFSGSSIELNGYFAGDTLSEQSDGNSGTDFVESAPLCYLRGTRILTPIGQVAVEALAIGDAVVTRFGAVQRIKWLGRQRYAPEFLAKNPEKWPVCIKAGALEDGVPARDLYVSPGHSMLIGDTLVLASKLVNGVTITQRPPAAEVNYVQIELSGHDCVLAEGAWSETYADAPGQRAQFHNAAEFYALYPDERPAAELSLCAPRPVTGERLNAALRNVVSRAGADIIPGWLDGYVERVEGNWNVIGWAHDPAYPQLPVLLEVHAGDRLLGTVLACDHRADLAAAGKGTGHCAFNFPSPLRVTPELRASLQIRRAADQAALPIAPEIQAAPVATPAPKLRLVV